MLQLGLSFPSLKVLTTNLMIFNFNWLRESLYWQIRYESSKYVLIVEFICN